MVGIPARLGTEYAQDADELFYLDTVATLYGRNQLGALITATVESVFVPITIGGGISSSADVRQLLNAGADKVALNTAAMQCEGLLSELSRCYGAQAISVSIDAKRVNGGWQAYTDNGRIPSGKDAIQWAEEACALGAGEIIVTSVDRDGTRKGPDIELLKRIQVDVPVIYSGGIRLQDVAEVAQYSDGMAVGASLHYGDCTIDQIKNELRKAGKEIR